MTIREIILKCQCPCCADDLSLGPEEEEILCRKGHRFPLINKRVLVLKVEEERRGERKNSHKRAAKSFSQQWRMFKDGDKIWGKTIEQWRSRFLKHMELSPQDLQNKWVLDLGCGHGLHSKMIAELGANVIGFDISDGFLGVDAKVAADPVLRDKAYYIQGDVFHLPFKDGVFDYIWSDGVLHHTADTKKAFACAQRALKKGGRFHLMVYRKGAPCYNAEKFFRCFTTKLPEPILVVLCYLGAPIFGFLKWFLNKIGRGYRNFEQKSIRENALSLHDTLSPPYAWHHSIEEVQGWFKDHQFTNIVLSDDPASAAGIYIHADKS
ncbi:MAG: class I SAM-dependent methyltransferase [Candidatus Omnitrophica bacterium]|nr:class I SAM-dependent methyltransferase [Candidatus Omnitrophota bacterium]